MRVLRKQSLAVSVSLFIWFVSWWHQTKLVEARLIAVESRQIKSVRDDISAFRTYMYLHCAFSSVFEEKAQKPLEIFIDEVTRHATRNNCEFFQIKFFSNSMTREAGRRSDDIYTGWVKGFFFLIEHTRNMRKNWFDRFLIKFKIKIKLN